MNGFVKRRGLHAPGSILDALDMFPAEVRFYREVAAVIRASARLPPAAVSFSARQQVGTDVTRPAIRPRP